MTRTELLAGAGAVAALASYPPQVYAEDRSISRSTALSAAKLRPGTLAYEASKAGMLFGTAAYARDFMMSGSSFDAPYRAAILRECSLLYPGYGMSPDATRGSNAGFTFKLVDPLLEIATKHSLAFAGGHLVWHQAVPKWVSATILGREAALAEMLLEVKTTAAHFAGAMDYWTVVNETVDPSYRLVDGLRKSYWLEQIGPDYIAHAFQAARDADPFATLILNENNLESGDPVTERKREAVLSLLQSLRNEKIPVQALGIQAHISADKPMNKESLRQFVTNVRDLGLGIYVTELDVFDISLVSDIQTRDATVASLTRDFLEVVLNHPGVPAINTWGLSDAHSWYNSSKTPPALRRSDGVESRGALLDDNMNQKPVYQAVKSAIDRVGSDSN